MFGIIIALSFLVLVSLLLWSTAKASERRWLKGGFVAHAVFTGGMLWFASVNKGDMAFYANQSRELAALMVRDFSRWTPEVVKMLFQQSDILPIVLGEGGRGTTGSMTALATFAFYVTGGGESFASVAGGASFPAVTLLVGTFGLIGRVLLYRVVRRELAPDEDKYAAIGCLMIPSAVFWTSGLLKETWAIAGLGGVVFSLYGAIKDKRWLLVIPAVPSAIVLGLIKPYVFFPLIVGVGAAFFSAKRGGRVKLRYIVLGVLVGVVGIAVAGAIFPSYAIDQVGTAIANQQGSYMKMGGRSHVEIGVEDEVVRDTSLGGQLKYAPLALVNALFRPFLFEAVNVNQFSGALENTAILVVLITLVFRLRLHVAVRQVVNMPILFAFAVFVLMFATAVGLSTQNLGTLSRYRTPMVPMYVTLLLVLRHRTRAVARAPAVVRQRPLPPRVRTPIPR